MQVNKTPKLDMSTSETGCCPKFDAGPWDGKRFVFKDKLFIKFKTRNFMHVPLNMGSAMKKTYAAVEKAGGSSYEFILLSHDLSPWSSEHYYSVTKEVEGLDNVKLSGTYLAKVFEGPYKNAGTWVKKMKEYVEDQDEELKKLYFYYTTCPKCAKRYKKNYVIGFAQV